ARCGSIRDAAIVRRDPAGSSARAWVFRKTVFRKTIAHRPQHGMPRAHEQAAAQPKQACDDLSPAADAGKPTNCPDARVDGIEAMPSEQTHAARRMPPR